MGGTYGVLCLCVLQVYLTAMKIVHIHVHKYKYILLEKVIY